MFAIEINEYQRGLLVRALAALSKEPGLDREPGDRSEPGLCSGEETMAGEVVLIRELFEALPALVKSEPGLVQSFCS